MVLGLLFSGNIVFANEDEHHKKHAPSDMLFKEMDLNNDSFISVTEFHQTYDKHSKDHHKSEQEHGSSEELFKEMDLNKDGSISLVELKEIYKKHSKEHRMEESRNK